MDDDCYWGRWTFSSEAEEKLKQLKLTKESEDVSLSEKTNVLEQLILQVFDKSYAIKKCDRITQSVFPEDDDYFTDSSLSTSVDDTEWEELKTYANKNNLNKNFKEQFDKLTLFDGSECQKDGGRLVSAYNNTKTDAKNEIQAGLSVKKPSGMSAGNLLLDDSLSQMTGIEMEPEKENDIIYLLKEALENEEPNDEDIAVLLNTNEFTEQMLLEVWLELKSSSSRLRLSSVIQYDKTRSVFLCQKLLLPWLMDDKFEQADEIVQKLSEIIPNFPNVAVKNLIIPLINNKECSVFTKDIFLLRDMMSHLESQYWNVLLQGLLENISIVKWHLPLLKMIIESIDNEGVSANSINRLLLLLNTVLNEFSEDRDFGLLIVAVISCVMKMPNVSEGIVERLKNIGENYKGSMHFKIMNSIKQLRKS